VYLGFFEARLLISRVSPAGERTAMINQNFRPAGAHWPGPVACRWHCRRGDRLNPFNDDARTIERGGEKKRDRGGWILVSGIPVSGPRERKRRPLVPTRRVPCFRRLSRSRFTFLSFCLPLPSPLVPSPSPFLPFEREIDGRRPFRKFVSGGVMDTMRAKRCVPITIDPGRRVRQNAFR